MPHMQRKKSESGFYHVVTKGDGGQVVFECESDRIRYLHFLEAAADSFQIDVHAYCLMSNHIHLLIADEKDNLSAFMKQLNEKYAMSFCKETGRVGHVFQGRFWNEPVESDEYCLAAVRYIHANPEPARLSAAKDYPWSSFRAYVGESSFVKTDFVLALLGGVSAFERFQASGGQFAKPFPASTLTRHLSPDELVNVALEALGKETLYAFKSMQPRDRVPYFERLHNSGFTGTEISRVTGVGISSVRASMSG